MPRARSFRLETLALAALVALGVVTGFVREFSGDFHYHVVLGQKTLALKHVYQVDDLSHTMRGHAMFVSAWLGDVLLALAWRAGAYVGVYVLRAACIAVLLVALAREMERSGLARVTAAAILLLLVAQTFFAFYARPETIAFALFGVTLLLLGESGRTLERWRLGVVVALMVVWANVHGSASIGLLAIGLWSAELFVGTLATRPLDRARLAIALGLPPVATLAACVNPEGWHAVLAFEVMRPTYVAHTTEWLPMRFGELPPILLVALFAVAATTLLAGRRGSPWRAMLVLVLALLTARYRRFSTFALIAAAPLLAVNLVALRARLAGGDRARVWRTVGVALTAGCAAWALIALFASRHLLREVGTGVDPHAYPEAACDFVRAHPPAGKLLNNYDFGSYLLFCQPQPVYIDQRAWSLYPDDFYAEYLHSVDTPARFAAFVDAHDIGWAFVGYDPLGRRFSAHPAFKLVYLDDRALVYARRSDALASLSLLDPYRLPALVDAGGDTLAEARRELDEQQRRCPDCYHTALARAAVATAAADDAGYDAAWARIIRFAPTWQAAYVAGRHALRRGDGPRAIEYFESIPTLGGDPRLARALAEAARRGDGR